MLNFKKFIEMCPITELLIYFGNSLLCLNENLSDSTIIIDIYTTSRGEGLVGVRMFGLFEAFNQYKMAPRTMH